MDGHGETRIPAYNFVVGRIMTSIIPSGDRHGELIKRISAFNVSKFDTQKVNC
jgi:hypothetical protein